jgi:mRNA interferase HigB
MRVIARRTLREFWERHSNAEQPLRAWYQDSLRAEWSSPQELKRHYRNASIVSDERVVFNIKGNEYRLVVAINYQLQILFIKFVGTHEEYDRIDAAKVEL